MWCASANTAKLSNKKKALCIWSLCMWGSVMQWGVQKGLRQACWDPANMLDKLDGLAFQGSHDDRGPFKGRPVALICTIKFAWVSCGAWRDGKIINPLASPLGNRSFSKKCPFLTKYPRQHIMIVTNKMSASPWPSFGWELWVWVLPSCHTEKILFDHEVSGSSWDGVIRWLYFARFVESLPGVGNMAKIYRITIFFYLFIF